MRILVFIFLVVLGWQGFALAQNSEPRFFSSMQDVPLMEGLTELPEMAVSFDKPEGRIIESMAEAGELSEGEIKTYYQTTLPQFGWTMVGDGLYARQGEYLQLVHEQIDDHRYLKLTVMPK